MSADLNAAIAERLFGYGGVGETKQTWFANSLPKYSETLEGAALVLNYAIQKGWKVEINLVTVSVDSWFHRIRSGNWYEALCLSVLEANK